MAGKDRGRFYHYPEIFGVEGLDQHPDRNRKIDIVMVVVVVAVMIIAKQAQARTDIGIDLGFADEVIRAHQFQSEFVIDAQAGFTEELSVSIGADRQEDVRSLEIHSHADLCLGD